MKLFILTTILLLVHFKNPTGLFKTGPTDHLHSLIRGDVGAYMARRDGGKLHTGVDIVANKTISDKRIYAVFAIKPAKVAYARMNGTDTSNYGYTIVLDHGDSLYSQYSHLAIKASKGLVKVGDEVTAGQVIAYMADPVNGEFSSGNVQAKVVMNYDKIQLHFEVFMAKPGVTSTRALSTIKKNVRYLDPTEDLLALGYQSF